MGRPRRSGARNRCPQHAGDVERPVLRRVPVARSQGVRRGAVFAYEGDPSWMVLTFDEPLADGPYSFELVGGDGVTHPVAGDVNLSADRAWGTQIPIAVHEAVLVRVLDDAGTPVMSAQLMRP